MPKGKSKDTGKAEEIVEEVPFVNEKKKRHKVTEYIQDNSARAACLYRKKNLVKRYCSVIKALTDTNSIFVLSNRTKKGKGERIFNHSLYFNGKERSFDINLSDILGMEIFDVDGEPIEKTVKEILCKFMEADDEESLFHKATGSEEETEIEDTFDDVEEKSSFIERRESETSILKTDESGFQYRLVQ